MLECYRGDDMKDFVYILDVMHQTSKYIFEEKKKSLEGVQEKSGVATTLAKLEGDLPRHGDARKDIMSILRECRIRVASVSVLTTTGFGPSMQ